MFQTSFEIDALETQNLPKDIVLKYDVEDFGGARRPANINVDIYIHICIHIYIHRPVPRVYPFKGRPRDLFKGEVATAAERLLFPVGRLARAECDSFLYMLGSWITASERISSLASSTGQSPACFDPDYYKASIRLGVLSNIEYGVDSPTTG